MIIYIYFYKISISDEAETIKKLTQQLHVAKTEISQVKLQLNHSNLKFQALSRELIDCQREKDEFALKYGEAEQDKLLFEVKPKASNIFIH